MLKSSPVGSSIGTVTSQPAGISCGSDCTEDYPPEPPVCRPNPHVPGEEICDPPVDQSVELTATEQNGFAIQSWTGCDSVSAGKCTVTMDDDKMVTANFADAQNPVAALTSPAEGSAKRGSVTIAANASDNWGVNKVDFMVNGIPIGSDTGAPYEVSFDSTTKADGTYTVGARATDFAGRISAVSTRSITIDNTPPDTTIAAGPAEGSSSTEGSATFDFTATEPGSTFSCRLYPSGGAAPAFSPCSSATRHGPVPLAAGTYVFEVVATDAYGNADGSPARRAFTILAPPTTGGGPGGGGAAGGGADTRPGELKPSIVRRWRLAGEMTAVTKLVVKNLARGATVDVRCKGEGCPFRSRRLSAKSSSVALTKLFDSELAPGSSIELRITQAGFVGKLYRFVTRPGKAPKTTVRCLPPGSSKPVAC